MTKEEKDNLIAEIKSIMLDLKRNVEKEIERTEEDIYKLLSDENR